ncbi:SDR family NAD(P)-dependent oxidoreductase [Streptomyces sp. NPDC047315]|uniref:SDR family NAD(P)-dependent oxidoreductase n=1 Tax=Streptomyces sp. NPDC047315 TaxID=3155142 RepID=UPI0033D6956C
MASLTGRVAVVTGAGRGLGREHALLLAAEGAKVVVNDPDSGPAHEVVVEIIAAGGEAVADTGRADDFAAAKNLVDTAVTAFGGLHILVNNAGITRDATVVKMTEAAWDSVVSVHMKGHFTTLHHAAAYWRDLAKSTGTPVGASVVNTSSGSGLRGNPGQLNYAAAKAGIAAMTVVAARELERYGVRVNAIAPVARTRMTMETPGLAEKLAVREGEFDQWHPGNVSPLVAWLAREDCKASGQLLMIRGSRIDVYDGWTVRETHEGDGRWTQTGLDRVLSSLPDGPPKLVPSA